MEIGGNKYTFAAIYKHILLSGTQSQRDAVGLQVKEKTIPFHGKQITLQFEHMKTRDEDKLLEIE